MMHGFQVDVAVEKGKPHGLHVAFTWHCPTNVAVANWSNFG